MTPTKIWGSLLIFSLCPLLGGLPLINWLTYGITGKNLRRLGTGNISVSAAFYHGGTLIGILAVLSEAAKGIGAVFLARAFFPGGSLWELLALIALVMGRYWMGKGAGTTNVVWGIVVHDPIAAGLIFLIGGVSFTIFRNRRSGRLIILILLSLILALRHPQETDYIVVGIILSSLIGWIYTKIPDDLDMPTKTRKSQSNQIFLFFRGDKGILSLSEKLDSAQVGNKAANLSQLKRLGYPVPEGWVLCPGDDFQPLIQFLEPSGTQPLAVRSSALGEDSQCASAAGQYLTVLNVTTSEQLEQAIMDCLASYNNSTAVRYRRDKQHPEKGTHKMAVLIQKQVPGVFSGVAFSRDPINQLHSAVVIEALPGEGIQVVSGRVTPQEYRVYLHPEPKVEGEGDMPAPLLKEIALVSREIEQLYHGMPQDIEWTYDGEQLWLLQTRPITTLQPIWTRKIAAEVIPGLIHPLTWSINRPLTCGVWGNIFTLVLGKRAQGLDFSQTATLHYHRAYFNATLLGNIFRRMGLPPESLDFLTRGAKFSKPPLKSTLRNIPGLLRLLGRELTLEDDFIEDNEAYFTPMLQEIETTPPTELSGQELLVRVEKILTVLRKATYYSILAPLSLALRQGIFQVPDAELDYSKTPEVKSLRTLAHLAKDTRHLFCKEQLQFTDSSSLFAQIAEMTDGDSILAQFEAWLQEYGYLSEAATDIAVPRWQDDPRIVRELFAQYILQPKAEPQQVRSNSRFRKLVQRRLDLKGRVTEVYSQLLAHLRWTFVALEGIIGLEGDIFLLQLEEIRDLINGSELSMTKILQQRRLQRSESRKITSAPTIIYGNAPAEVFLPTTTPLSPSKRLQGIGASPGVVEGKVKILLSFRDVGEIDKNTILVVPYTDSGWAPMLARAGGIIAEVGGRLSHGAIVAREYGIPAVMDVDNATLVLEDGQRVRIDGKKGVVEILGTANSRP
ncbi:MAG: glycerol-3-phosphate acyltransferase [Prochloron sp. SP5CPC1]|nr:glycerol-3-phosphate acyltransferase [Candidatus Paraprochloron terpiosi SP5CPC1]